MASAPGEGISRTAGNRFPMALRGYEASAVDAHIDALERQLAVLVDQSRSIGEQIARLEDELASATARVDGAVQHGSELSEHEVRRPEGMTESIMAVLRSAHEEAAAVRAQARSEAEAILADAEARLADADRRALVVGEAEEERSAGQPTS